MWIRVYRQSDGQNITTATFSVAAYNDGNGWYWMYIGYGQSFCVSAPGYNTLCGNTDSYGAMYAALTVYTPPSTCGNCWS